MDDLTINGVVPGSGTCPALVREGAGSRPCRARAGEGMLMCRSHWRAVPAPIQSHVYAAANAYNAGMMTLANLRETQLAAVEAVSP